MHTPVSWRKRKRLTLKSHTVKTVMINKNIMANKKAVSMAWYLFSFSAAALSFSFSTSTVLVSVIAKINAKRAHNFTNSVDLFAAMLMPGWWQSSIQATTGYYRKGKGAGTRGERGTVIVTVIVVTRFVETVPWRLLQRIARMDMLLKKLDQLFQVVSAP